MKKILLIPALFVALPLVNGCSRREAPGTAAPVPVLTARAMETNVPVLIDPPPVGHVTPVSSVTVRPQVGGMISSVNFQEGQEVKAGDLLFTIDARPMQAALDQAKANLQRDKAQMENSQIQFDREQKLFAQKLVSQDEFDTSKAAFDTLVGTVSADRAAVTNAELNLAYTQIRAPIDGATGALLFHQGNVVKSPDDTLLTINQIHPIYVQFGVPEQFLPEIRSEMRDRKLKVVAMFQNMNVVPPQGELTFVDNTVDATTGMIQLKATFPNTNNALWPGQFVQVQLTLSELTNVVVVPTPAVQTGQNGEFIYVVKPDETVEERPVTIGVSYDGHTVIQKGMAAGETVVTDGQLRLAPGFKVSAKAQESANETTGSAAQSGKEGR